MRTPRIAASGRHGYCIVPLLMLAAALSVGCAAKDKGPKMAEPTEEDRLLVERAEAMAGQMAPGTPGWEPAMALQRGAMKEAFEAVKSDKQVKQGLFNWGKRQIEQMIDLMQKSKRWPAPRNVEAPYAKQPPKIDGKLDDAIWQDAASYPVAFGVNEAEPIENPFASAKVAWDEQNLYFAFTVEDEDVHAPDLERDGRTFTFDTAEVFVFGKRRWAVYWEINVSPSNSIYDALMYKFHDKAWGHGRPGQTVRGLTVGSTLSGTSEQSDDVDEGYTVEFALPFDQIPGVNLPVEAGDELGLLLGLADKDATEEGKKPKLVFYSHSPVLLSFHNLETYGKLLLKPAK